MLSVIYHFYKCLLQQIILSILIFLSLISCVYFVSEFFMLIISYSLYMLSPMHPSPFASLPVSRLPFYLPCALCNFRIACNVVFFTFTCWLVYVFSLSFSHPLASLLVADYLFICPVLNLTFVLLVMLCSLSLLVGKYINIFSFLFRTLSLPYLWPFVFLFNLCFI